LAGRALPFVPSTADAFNLESPDPMRQFLREPLLHFLLVGIGLFVLYGQLRGGESGAPREIVVSAARVEALAQSFATVWMRPPTAQEIKGLVDDFVAEEIYYREAIAMGLDQDDTVIRRRLRQKMEFISEDAAASIDPTEAQLQAYLAGHPEKFVSPAELTFRQVYFSTERRGEAARQHAERLLAELQAGRGPANLADAGDPTLLPQEMQAESAQVIANTFGSEFAEQLQDAPVGQWSGPVRSGFGLHLVRVVERGAATRPSLEEIRPIVLREWQAEQRTLANQEFLRTLRARYEVRVEGPAAALLGSAAKSARAPDEGLTK
jgi:parvulin-like peptidyl-prolyl isomerase